MSNETEVEASPGGDPIPPIATAVAVAHRDRRPGVDGFDEEFEADYLVRFAESKRRNHEFYHFQSSYHYGFELATDRRYADSDWKVLEPQARRVWSGRNSSTSWDEIKDAVQYSYDLVKSAAQQ